MLLIKCRAGTTGRVVRIVAGIAMITVGLFALQNTTGTILAVVGLAPLLAGLLDFCVFAPLFGASFSGKAIRAAK